MCSFWSITRLNPRVKDLEPFHSKQRAAALPGQHQALGLYFPYFWSSQRSILPPVYNKLLQSQCHRCHQRYLVATWNSEFCHLDKTWLISRAKGFATDFQA